ncbi:hypothetical protein TWF679_007779 [Orbilia oligospora]|uniref:Uncharacterized protein n=1 Tax=Orbilia oligospora TaxID=2813651 RepID=A0A8H8V6L6_ORBOL|nr:hypothetical protein TWF679_007779 [Orbilia oligospora]
MTSARKKFTYGPPTLHPAPWRQYFVKFVQVDILKEALGQWKLVKWAGGVFSVSSIGHLIFDWSLKDRVTLYSCTVIVNVTSLMTKRHLST